MTDNSEPRPATPQTTEPVWADDNGEFLLRDGTSGNPGCDCGEEDAVVRIGAEYLCASAAAERGITRADRP